MVSNITLAMLFAVCLTASATAKIAIRDTEADELTETHYLLASYRGLFQGFERGLYGNSTLNVSSLCLAEDSATNAVLVYDDYVNGNIADIFTTVLAAYNFQYSLNQHCGINDVTYDLLNFLGTANFTFANLINGFMLKFFTITGALNNIGMIFYTSTLPPISNSNAYFTIYQTVG